MPHRASPLVSGSSLSGPAAGWRVGPEQLDPAGNQAVRPSGRFDDLLAAIDGLGRENNLALLNLAASLLEPGESYVEVGSYKGRSLAAAMRGNDGDFVGIDNWQMDGCGRSELLGNLARLRLPAVGAGN
jgi:hypothetical protein